MPGGGEGIHDDTLFGECYRSLLELDKENKALAAELDKARQEAREARLDSRALREEVR